MGIIYGTAVSFAIAIAIGIPYYFFVEDRLVPAFDPQIISKPQINNQKGKGSRKDEESTYYGMFKASFLFKLFHRGTKI